MGIFPAGELIRELVLALGAAMFVGSFAVVVKERRRPPFDKGPKPNMKIVILNLAIGVLLAIWGLGSILAAH